MNRKGTLNTLVVILLAASWLAACAGPAETALPVQENTPLITQPAAEASPVIGEEVVQTEVPAIEEPVTATENAAEPRPQPRPVIIDTDMAADDWMAILYLLQRSDLAVQAITVAGTGEAHCEPGVKNALGLVALAGYEPIPVACGRETPLQGNHAFPDSWRTWVDSLTGLELPDGGAGSEMNAVELITSILQSSPMPVTLFASGPLTNLAELFQSDPSLTAKIEMLYIMGGAVHVPGNVKSSVPEIDNVTAEWNIYADPTAAKIVFESGVPITLVGLDATQNTPASREFYAALSDRHITPEAEWLYELYTRNTYLYESNTMYFWDQLTAVVLSDESVAEIVPDTVCVTVEEGPGSGQTVSAEGCPAMRVAVSADRQKFEQSFLETLNTGDE